MTVIQKKEQALINDVQGHPGRRNMSRPCSYSLLEPIVLYAFAYSDIRNTIL